MLSHEKSIQNSKVTYDCNHCGKPFGNINTLNRHGILYPDKKCVKLPFGCKLCPYRVQFSVRDSLLRHVRKYHKKLSDLQEKLIKGNTILS